MGWVGIGIGLIGYLISGSMRFQALETRINNLDSYQSSMSGKLDSITSALARIEGRLDEERSSKNNGRR